MAQVQLSIKPMHGVQQASNVLIVLANNGDVGYRQQHTVFTHYTSLTTKEIQQVRLRCRAESTELPADSNKYKLPKSARQGNKILLANMH